MKSLKELREHNNLKQREVAQHIGVSDRVYAYYEKGRTLPAKYVKPLANLFGISCDEFLENTENPLVWEREFGCIERLDLPTWEEFDKKGYFEFVSADGTKLVLEKTLTVDCDREPISYYVLEILVNDYDHRLLFESEYTKENYTLACRKAKELFLGEKK